MNYDWEGRWNEKLFYKYLKDFYNKYVVRKKFTQGYAPKFRTELYELQNLIKERLKMESRGFEQRYMPGVHVRTV